MVPDELDNDNFDKAIQGFRGNYFFCFYLYDEQLIHAYLLGRIFYTFEAFQSALTIADTHCAL
jgi:hypothetical protein